MSVAKILGVDDVEGPALMQARGSWTSWTASEPDLGVVDDLADLRRWTKMAEYEASDKVLRALAKLGSPTGGGDATAITALTWTLIPGAIRVAYQLSDLAPNIDELVASHLWSSARTFSWELSRPTATSILRDTRRGVHTELGVGDAARRADRTWFRTVCVDKDSPAWQRVIDSPSEDWHDTGTGDLLDLFADAAIAGVITATDRTLLIDLAVAAHERNNSARRGRGGMVGAAAVEVVATRRGMNPRSVRRRAARSLDRLRDFSTSSTGENALESGRRPHRSGLRYAR